MKLIDFITPLLLAAGFLFIITGLNILLIENAVYSESLSGLYTLILYSFYLYLVLLFLTVLVGVLDSLLNQKWKKT